MTEFFEITFFSLLLVIAIVLIRYRGEFARGAVETHVKVFGRHIWSEFMLRLIYLTGGVITISVCIILIPSSIVKCNT
jgi:hypothetical protein